MGDDRAKREGEVPRAGSSGQVLQEISSESDSKSGTTSGDDEHSEDSDALFNEYIRSKTKRKRERTYSASSVASSVSSEESDEFGKQFCPNRWCDRPANCGCSDFDARLTVVQKERTIYLPDDIFDREMAAARNRMRRKLVHSIIPSSPAQCCEHAMSLISDLSKRTFALVFYHGYQGASCFRSTPNGYPCDYSLPPPTKSNAKGPDSTGSLVDKRHASENAGQNSEMVSATATECDFGQRSIDFGGRSQRLDTEEEDEANGCDNEKPHFHVIHDCQWHGSSCRCINLPCRRRYAGHDIGEEWEETCRHIKSLLEYGNRNKRYNLHIKIGTFNIQGRRDCGRTSKKLLPVPASMGHRYLYRIARQSMETELLLHESVDEPTRQDVDKVFGVPRRGEKISKGKRRRGEQLYERLESFIFENPCYPISDIKITDAWLASPFRSLTDKNEQFPTAMFNIRTRMTRWKVDDFMKYYIKYPCQWSAVACDFGDFYLSIIESAEEIYKMLQFQLYVTYGDRDNFVKIIDFLNKLYAVAERKDKKTNAIYVVAPTSSGKNWLFDSLCAFYLNVGMISNYTRACQFPFEDAPNRRLLMWNEINFMDSAVDTVKMLIGGDPFSANIKFKTHQVIHRTPVIILSNPPNVLTDPAFRDRVHLFRFHQYPYLKDIKKYPHPLAIPFLWYKFRIHQFTAPVNNFFRGIEDNEDYEQTTLFQQLHR